MTLFRKRAPRDPVADQLKSLARQGSGMAKVAHLFAFVLIILFSLGSLVALGGDALSRVQAGIAQGSVDISSAISLGVTVLLVPCMDMAMLYAAGMLRLLATRRATKRDMVIHGVVLGGVAIIEAATYVYMAALYEHPSTAAAWALIVARALAAPLIGVYLSMARALPVTPRDILYQAELSSGAGVLRDVALAANDPTASLDEKMRLYGAAAEMRESDRWRLDSMIAAVRVRTPLALPPAIVPPGYTDKPPTGPGTPSARSSVRTGAEAAALRDDAVASTAVELPVRTQAAAQRRAGLAAIREKRQEAVVRWLRAADERGQSLSVRTVRSRLEKMEPRQRVSESTVLQLMRDARKQLDAERHAPVSVPPGQLAQ